MGHLTVRRHQPKEAAIIHRRADRAVRNILIIFTKYPEPGSVKTRLSADIGKEKAALLYRAFVEAIIRNTEDSRFKRVIFFAPAGRRRNFKDWLGGDIEMMPQAGRGLGERLSNAFGAAFKKGARRVVVIGTDSPLIDRANIIEAFNALEDNECVIGPSADGGYYLLGASSFHADIFRDIEWSSDKVFAQTMGILDRLGISKAVLSKGFDVDTRKDLLKLKRCLQEEDGRASPRIRPLMDTLNEMNIFT